ncbi:MAG TPA: AAA family ATPase [Candidatus Binatia bacterium]|nr:AAA family ATPase [Candidatus Binatia bacterium]
MIATDKFAATFALMPPGDRSIMPTIARTAARNGYAVVPIAPNGKTPLCTLTARQAKAADKAAQEAAREAGRGNWEDARHACGIAHAITDPAVADRVFKRLTKERGGPINIGVEVGRSRMVLVDADTDEQVKAYIATWQAEQPDMNLAVMMPTVSTPGVMQTDENGVEQWRHKDGGHFWYELPDDCNLDGLPGHGTLRDDTGFQVYWRDHQGLVPPSLRPEGPYILRGQVGKAPKWLLDRIWMAAESWALRRAQQAAKVRYDGDPIDIWSAATPWADLLEADGWTNTGKVDRCSCPIWTRPGDAAHWKSATTHEPGCTNFEISEDRGGFMRLWTDSPPQFLADWVARSGKKSLSKLQYHAARHHDGDVRAAMSDLEISAIYGEDGEIRDELLAMLDALAAGDEPSPVVPQPETTVPIAETHSQAEPAGTYADDLGGSAPDSTATDSAAADSTATNSAGTDSTATDDGPAASTELPGIEAYRDELARNRRLRFEVSQLYIRDRAKTIFEEMQGHADARGLRARLDAATDRASELPDDEQEVRWRVDGLWMQGQRVMLAAKMKVGKTTVNINLERSLVDGKPFCGQFETTAITGNLLVVNAEMTGRQYRDWLRKAPIDNRDKILALHLREARLSDFNLLNPVARRELVAYLKDHGVTALLLDPLGPLFAAADVDENSANDVGRWFGGLNDVVAAAEVSDQFLTHHFGHSNERTRGSSKLMDTPDAIWFYTADDETPVEDDEDDSGLLANIALAQPARYLRAFGRDVQLPRSRVEYDDDTKLLSIPRIGDGPRSATQKAGAASNRRRALLDRIERVVASRPPSIKYSDLWAVIGGNKDEFRDGLEALRESGRLVETQGPHRARIFAIAVPNDTPTT